MMPSKVEGGSVADSVSCSDYILAFGSDVSPPIHLLSPGGRAEPKECAVGCRHPEERASEGNNPAALGSPTFSLQDREDTLLLSKPPCLPCFVMVAAAPNPGPFQRGHREEGALASILH